MIELSIMNPRLIIALLFIIPTTAPLHAEIGATPEQSVARYGKPEREALKETSLLYFRQNGLCTIAHFDQGQCDILSIFSSNELMGLPEAIEYGKRASLLKSEGGGAEWKPLGRVSFNEVWNSSDKKSFAIYDTMRHKLIIMTRAAYAREKKAHEAQAARPKATQ